MTAAQKVTDGTYFDSPADEFHLACLLLSRTGRDYLGVTLGQLDPEDFYHPVYGWLWGAARKIAQAGGSVTKRSLLAAREAEPKTALMAPAVSMVRAALEEISGEPVYISRLSASVRTVKQAAQLRRLVEALDRARNYVVTAEDYSQALGTAWDLLKGVEETEVPADVVPFADLVDQFEKAQASGPLVGDGVVPSPWPDLDEVLGGGFKPGRMYVVGGRPNAGKSILGINCAQIAAEMGIPSLVVSAEMSALEVAERVIAAGAQGEYREITKRSMSDYTSAAVGAYTRDNRNMPLYVLDKPGMTVEYIAGVGRTMKRRTGCGLIVADYAQLLEPSDKRAVREQQVAHISHALKQLARELWCPVIVLAQLNKDNLRGNRPPTIADFRESDALSQDPDAAILLHHEVTEHGQHTGWVTLIVDKNRFGPKANVSLPWRAHQARLG